MMNYFITSDKKDCCSCGVCAQVCPKKCITYEKDECGIPYPVVNKEECINCKKCEKACPLINAESLKQNTCEKSYALILDDEKKRAESSSGGAFSAIMDAVCDDNTYIYGAEMSGCSVVHSEASNIEEAGKFKKSKYIKSDTLGIWHSIKDRVESGSKVLFSGTPCQVAALKSFLGKDYDNLFTVELVCHGVPGQALFDSFVRGVEKKYKNKVKTVKMRIKDGKGDFYVSEIVFENGRTKALKTWQNPWMLAYSKKVMFMDSCYSCVFASEKRTADLTIGDLWGGEKLGEEWEFTKGISLLLVNSAKGQKIVNGFSEVKIKEYCFQDAVKRNPNLIAPTKCNEKTVKQFKEAAVKDFVGACKRNKFMFNARIGRLLRFLPAPLRNKLKKIAKV